VKSLRVADLMTREIHHVSPRQSVLDLEHELATHRISGAPVLDRAHKVLGIVSRSDVDRALDRERSRAAALSSYYLQTDPPLDALPARDPTDTALDRLREMCVEDIMTRQVLSVAPDAPLREAATCMRDHRVHRVLVIDGETLVGVLSSSDIVAAVAEHG